MTRAVVVGALRTRASFPETSTLHGYSTFAMRSFFPVTWMGALAAISVVCGCAAEPRPEPAAPVAPTRVDLAARIVTPDDVTTEPELAHKAERLLMIQSWQEAIDAYRTLIAADPAGPHAADYMFNLGLALEGAEERDKARDVFLDLAHRFPDGPRARSALVRSATLDAYIEDWKALGAIGDEILARKDLEDVDRLVGLGSRGLARVELGDDINAAADIHDGLDLSDQLHYGERDVLPVAVAQLRFALGELRRVRSEKISFDPLPPDFVDQLEVRCGGLLEAQAAYAKAVQSIDPHWAAMSGYRVGQMYRELHRALMQIPPPTTSKTERQKQIFYAFMHKRYRVLLEKGLKEIDQTIALGERTSDSSAWITRARDAKHEMETALADEKAQMEKMPFTEADIDEALKQLAKKTPPRH
jgi:hypothetical protein